MENKVVTILLVEDNHGDARLFRETLSDAGFYRYRLTHVENLREAIENLNSHKIDIVLLDLSLPDSSGLKTFNVLHSMAPEVPIVVLSGLNDDSVSVRAVQSGAQDYLVKGQVDSHMMVRTMRYAIERHKMLIEIEELRRMEHRMAYYDQLTGLPNRQLYYDRIGQALNHAERNKERVALMFLDLDGFKSVNDRYGHDTGDILLKAVAERLSDYVRKSDTLARLGGDEFVFVLSGVKNMSSVSIIAHKILQTFNSPFHLKSCDLSVTGSLGIALYPDDTVRPEVLLKCADAAMYFAKENGKNRFQFYTDIINAALFGTDSNGKTLTLMTGPE